MTNPTDRFLIVDDSAFARMMIAAVVREVSPGLEILEADCAEKAQEILASDSTIQWATLDHNMPGKNGLELAAELRSSHPDLKLSLITANVQSSTKSEAERLGLTFFDKPIDAERLATQLRDWLQIHA